MEWRPPSGAILAAGGYTVRSFEACPLAFFRSEQQTWFSERMRRSTNCSASTLRCPTTASRWFLVASASWQRYSGECLNLKQQLDFFGISRRRASMS